MLHRPRIPAPSQCRRLLSLHKLRSRSFSGGSKGDGVDNRASSKLFADAALDEETSETTSSSSSRSSSRSSVKLLAQQQHPNWTGEESMQDAVLRMLVDKYKPLRGELRSADERLKNAPPKVTRTEHDAVNLSVNEGDTIPDVSKVKASESTSEAPPKLQSTPANEPILPGIEGHKPWHVTFKPPSHAINVTLGNITTSSSSAKSPLSIINQDHIAKAARDRAAKKRSEQAQRLTKAREETLDYKLGIKGSGKGGEGVRGRTNPVVMRGWASLVEERIERARSEGHFASLKGRGQPLTRETAEHNPFIEREEFLMNRIVQRNGAAPAWVELQTELESSLNAFRSSLRASYTRYAIRTLTASSQPTSLPPTPLRFPSWERLEQSYHDAALSELNALIRRYNTVAPYPVRRPFLSREGEIARVGEVCWGKVIEGVKEREKVGEARTGGIGWEDDEGGKGGAGASSSTEDIRRSGPGVWEVVRGWIAKLRLRS